ncbi:MAG: PrgI family protein [Patescibacteria group bacterium]
MQFKVPQNIDMEDKIIGPLTLTQFFYLLFGGVIIYILFGKLVLTGYSFLFWILAIPLGTFSFAMAFIKIQDRPFPSFFFAMIKYITTPRARVWQHYTRPNQVKPKAPVAKPTNYSKKSFDTVRVNELAEIMDKDLPRAKE